MPRAKKRRKPHQGVDKVVGYLRKMVEDPSTTPVIRLKCIDRLCLIDQIYNVLTSGKLVAPVIVPEEPDAPVASSEEIKVEPQNVGSMLDAFKAEGV